MIKILTGLTVWSGVGTIVGTAIKYFTPGNMSKFNKICTTIGGLALTGLVADKASEYALNAVDETVCIIQKAYVKEETE